MTDMLTAAGVPSTVWNTLLPPDVLSGLKMNLNPPVAPWGSFAVQGGVGGIGGVGVLNTQYPFQLYSGPGTLSSASPPGSYFNYDEYGLNLTLTGALSTSNTGDVQTIIQARQLRARYLYVMALLLHYDPTIPDASADPIYGKINLQFDPGYFTENGSNGTNALTGPQQKELTIRRIAQWAINVVDSQSPDSIMTPFKYDKNPFTAAGWRCRQ